MLVITLVAIVLIFTASIAMLRSVQASQYSAGNLAFKRDLTNQADLGINAAITAIGGGLGNTTALATSNYSAVQLVQSANAYGTKSAIPDVLLATPAGTAPTGLNSSLAITGTGGATIYYVIDRMCNSTMNSSIATDTDCSFRPAGNTPPVIGGEVSKKIVTAGDQIVYRISVRVDGPRGTQAFTQATVAF